MWVSRDEWDRLKRERDDLAERLDRVERVVGVRTTDSGSLYSSQCFRYPDPGAPSLNDVVAALAEAAGLQVEPARGATLKVKPLTWR